MKKLLILDGNSIVNRAFYGVSLLSTGDGLYTNAIYGFLNILLKYTQSENPDYTVIAFDLKAPTFRHKKYDGYKANRKGMPEELHVQMPVLKEVLAAMNIACISLEGYEADDLIGTVAKKCEEENVECLIVTGDRDSLQLAGNGVNISIPSTRFGVTSTELMTPERIKEKYGITPKQVIDLKSLMGDSSDNIPGVPGIGEKTAVKLLNEYETLDGVYANIENMKGSVRQKLENGKDSAYLSYFLATIDRNVPLENTLADFETKPYNDEKLAEILTRLEFSKMLDKLNLKPSKSVKKETLEKVETVVVNTKEAAETAVKEISESGNFAYYIFLNGGMPCALSVRTERKYYCFIMGEGLFANYGIEDISGIFTCTGEKISHSLKDDIVLLHSYDTEINGNVFDTSIAAYIDDPTRKNYDIGAMCGFETYEGVFGKGKKQLSPLEIPEQRLCEYGYSLTEGMFILKKRLEDGIKKNGQEKLLYDIEFPLCRVLADMEIVGFKVDTKSLAEFGTLLQDSIEFCKKEIYNIAGEEFNINSTKQLGEILFEKLGLKVIRKTKTGYSTDSDVLEKLSDQHEIINYIKEYRTLVKLKSTYADGLIDVINKADGKIHSKFNQTVTATGRISSTEPNLQNIPVRMELGREIRKMFTAQSSEYVLIDADYSQIELRVLAHISGDETMINAFKSEDDIHAITASQVFNVPLEEVTHEMRSNAKAVNFGIVYGISDFALAGDLKITKKMAKQYIEGYLDHYPKIKKYMSDIVEFAKENGYVETILKRRRYIPELKDSKFAVRSFGERVALNTPIQGSAADIIKLAMVKVYNALKEKKMKSRLILQVHDELIVEAYKPEADEVMKILRENMEHAAGLSVPLTVDINKGDNWYAAKG